MNLHKSNLQLFDTDPYKRNQRSSSHTIYKDQTHTPIMQSLHGIEDKSNFLQETIYIIIEKVKQEIIQQFKSEGSVKGEFCSYWSKGWLTRFTSQFCLSKALTFQWNRPRKGSSDTCPVSNISSISSRQLMYSVLKGNSIGEQRHWVLSCKMIPF